MLGTRLHDLRMIASGHEPIARARLTGGVA
jgi:hypothetical protein